VGFVAATMRHASTNATQRVGASQTEGGDEHAGVKGVIDSSSSLAHWIGRRNIEPLAATRPTEACSVDRAEQPRELTNVSRPHLFPSVAGSDAPLIGERAANARAYRNGRWRWRTPVCRGIIRSSLANPIERR
jgi:hypothetical protein